MSGNKYTKTVITILHLLNYNKIGDETGKTHIVLNVADIILISLYFIFSMWSVITEGVTLLLFIINIVILARMMVISLKGSIVLRNEFIKKYTNTPGLLFKSVHDYTFLIECCLIIFSLLPFWFIPPDWWNNLFQFFITLVIILGFLESLMNVFAELFKASISLEN